MRSRRLLAMTPRTSYPLQFGALDSANFRRAHISHTAQPLFDPLRRPAERDQFIPRMTRRRIKSQRTKIGTDCVVYPPLYLKRMPKLQMRIGGARVEVDRFSVGRLRFRDVSGFLQGMAILDPHFGHVRHVGERVTVMPGGKLPPARLLGALGPQDLRASRAAGLARTHPRNPVAVVMTDTGEDRADDFAGGETAGPARSEQARTDTGGVEPGGLPALPQPLVEPMVREDCLMRCR